MTKKLELHEAVLGRIQDAGAEILERAIGVLAEKTIEKRVQQVVAAYTEIDTISKELRRFKPDVKTYSAEGQETLNYSDARWAEKKKKEERLEKIQKLLEVSLKDPSKFQELAQAIGDNHSKGGSEEK